MINENIDPSYTIGDYYDEDETMPKDNVIRMDYIGELEVKDYGLSQNFPNPFNPSTIINYQLPKDSRVTIKIYDILGKDITTLVNDYKSAGRYSVEFNAENLPSGIYFYELKANDFVTSKKMLLVK